jgi:pimeloyl-ACP methyl ester carboxylesterase
MQTTKRLHKHPLLLFLIFPLFAFACRWGGTLILPGSQPEPTTPAFTSTDPLCRELIPGETNPAITQWNDSHIVCTPGQSKQRGELFVFLPGTNALPSYYTQLLKTAAEEGFHVIALRYPNDESINFDLCPKDGDDQCHQKVRQEIMQGVDVSPHVAVDRQNSIEARLASVLIYLNKQLPAEGWGPYLENGSLSWSSIIVAGHSQGGGHAVYLAKLRPVQRAIAFSWVDVRRRELAPWITEMPSNTPAENFYLFWHQDDHPIAGYQPELMTALGLDSFGMPVIVDQSNAPYQDAHAMIATTPPPQDQIPHNTHVVDFALNYDAKGDPLYKDVWRYLLTLEIPAGEVDAAAFPVITVKAARMGNTQNSYIDPEFYSGASLITFADEKRKAWLGTLNPHTGDFTSQHGRDILIDDNLTPLQISFNAPEFGISENGWSLYYTKDYDGIPQIWRAKVNGGSVTKAAITTDDVTRLSVLASKDPTMSSTHLLYAYNGFALQNGKIAWLDESNPQTSETVVAPIDRGVRWVTGTASFVFVEAGQVILYDTKTGIVKTVTNSAGMKSYAYGWIAPETNQMMILTIVDNSRLEIYADSGSEYWNLVSTLIIPAASAYSFVSSPETFTAGGKSYITLVVKESTNYALAEVWVWGIQNDADRFMLQCNDGQGEVIRSDPESLIGANEVFLYYNVIRKGAFGGRQFELYRCSTGLMP